MFFDAQGSFSQSKHTLLGVCCSDLLDNMFLKYSNSFWLYLRGLDDSETEQKKLTEKEAGNK